MNDVVFILGAGTSANAGVPLMANFLDKARDLLVAGKVDDQKNKFELVFKGIAALQQVHSKANVDIHNIESVFSAFEMAKLLGAFGPFGPEELEAFRKAMPIVIAKTIEETMILRVEKKTPPAHVCPPQEYVRFGELLENIIAPLPAQRKVTILSFNYDVALELALPGRGLAFTNGLAENTNDQLALLKLHGSVSWFRCKCGVVVDYPAATFPWSQSYLRGVEEAPLKIADFVREGKFRHCEGEILSGPIVVPPVWSKLSYHEQLSNVWTMAAERLGLAESIVAIGYSLPETDAFFRYLYALGSIGEAPLRRFWVFNPDDSGSTEARFRSLLGRGAENRFKYFPMTFHDFLSSPEAKELRS